MAPVTDAITKNNEEITANAKWANRQTDKVIDCFF
jgi:hypothetical protein